MSELSYEKAKKVLVEEELLDFETSFNLSKYCALLLGNRDTEFKGRDLIIRTLDVWSKIDKKTSSVWNDLIEYAGLHPYVDINKLTGGGCIRQEFSKSSVLSDVYLHEEQAIISLSLLKSKSVVVSAPTSFGKSLLIEEVVASKKYNNIVIIQPTLALLDETRKKMQKYSADYNIVVSTSQEPIGNKNLFLFTGERVVEYKHFPKIDFFIIDEFYKLSMARDDERAPILNQALYLLLKHTHNFYMLGPGVRNISKDFIDKYKASWHNSNFSTVSVDIHDMESQKNQKEKKLFKLLEQLDEPTLVYCSSPSRATKLITEFLLNLADKELKALETSKNKELIDWIDENIHKEWILAKALNYSIGFHHGAVPRHLASSIVDAFNKGDIKYLFCTSSLIEGVNTSAKNVILFDKTKGTKPIDYFDFKNIAGRSGRMKKHFIGRVYQLEKQPQQLEFDVEIPLFSQSEDIPLELIVQMEKKDLNEKSLERLKNYSDLDKEIQIILKKNKGVSIDGQLKILDEIEKNFNSYHSSMKWTSFPHYNELERVIDLCWRHLLKKDESRGGVLSSKQLTMMTYEFSRIRSLQAIINKQIQTDYWKKANGSDQEKLQKVIQIVLQTAMHWFDYKLPKWLSVISELQSYAFKKKGLKAGSYSFFASYLESNCLPEHLSIMQEYGIPTSAIRKIEIHLKDRKNFEEIKEYLKKIDLKTLKLLPYELEKIQESLL